MSNTAIQLKKSGASGNTPSGLSFGEVALNYADGKLYYKNSLNGISYISNQFSFDTINSNGSLILSGSTSDTLSFVAGNNVTISTNTTTKTITINASVAGGSDPGPAFDRANASYTAQNTTANFANAAFDRANAAYAQANTGTTDTWVRTQANNAYNKANSAGSFANGSFITANSAADFANGAFAQANAAADQAVTGSIAANGAFDRVNSSYVVANSSYTSQNTTAGFANAAYAHANAAYAKANTGTTALDVNSEIIAFTIAFS
jgi:hypothetical protein